MKVTDWLHRVLTQQQPTGPPRRAVVWGAGGMGRRMVHALADRGVEVLAILDQRAQDRQRWDEIPILLPSQWAGDPSVDVVIGLHNPTHSVADVVALARGAWPGVRVWTPIDVVQWWPDALPGSYWLASRDRYLGHVASIEKLWEQLADAPSRQLLTDLLTFRLGLNLQCEPACEPGQYMPASLPRWQEPLRFVDCGAYDGDTLRALRAHRFDVGHALCFEPDPVNYARLLQTVEALALAAVCLPCAVSERAEVLRFRAEGSGASRSDGEGDVHVQALALDEIMHGQFVSLIKMDVEGYEPQALRGAWGTIERYRPVLALSVYHEAEHLWQIPLSVAERLPDYRLYLRAHGCNSFDVVLYALPAHLGST